MSIAVTYVITITIVFGLGLPIQKQANMQPQKFILQNVTNQISIENYSSVRVTNEKGRH